MRILLTGAAGVVGSVLCQNLRGRCYEVIPVDIVDSPGIIRMDLRNSNAAVTLLSEHRPDVILHLAANKNVFFCEENISVTHEINFGITENLTRACMNSRSRMLFLSTDYVFGAKSEVFFEDSQPCPTTQYGQDKAESEAYIEGNLDSYVIMRSAGLYGFPGDLIQVVRQAISKGQRFNAFANLKNCPTSLNDFFCMLDIIISRELNGIFHCVGREFLSRFDYALQVAKALGLDASLIYSEMLDFSQDVRPPCLHLDGTKTYSVLGYHPLSLIENIKMNFSLWGGS